MATRKEMRARIGDHRFIREGQLAFAYGIGMPYRRVEFEAHRAPIAVWIWRYLNGKAAADVMDTPREQRDAEIGDIEKWLKVNPTPEHVAAVEAARKAFWLRKQERSARIRQERAPARAG